MSRFEDMSACGQDLRLNTVTLLHVMEDDEMPSCHAPLTSVATTLGSKELEQANKQLGLPNLDVTGDGSLPPKVSGPIGVAITSDNCPAGGTSTGHTRLTDNGKKASDSTHAIPIEVTPPVPLGEEPTPERSFWRRLTEGPVPRIGEKDEFPSQYYPQSKNVGLMTTPADSPEKFAQTYPKLAEYNERVAKEVNESGEYGKLLGNYLKTLDPKERDQIAKEYEAYKKEDERLRKEYASRGPHVLSIEGQRHPEPGPHLKAYLEQVHQLKIAAHEHTQAQKRAIATELGPEFKKQQSQWEAERFRNMTSM